MATGQLRPARPDNICRIRARSRIHTAATRDATQVNTIHLFGGGPLVPIVADIAIHTGWGLVWRTSPRLSTSAEIPSHGSVSGPFCHSRLADVMRLGKAPEHPADFAISLGSPWIFSSDWLNSWGKRAINLHSTPLPRHRGGGGGSWQVLMQDNAGAATLHELTGGVDAGPVVAQKKFTYSLPMTAESWSVETLGASKDLLYHHLPRVLEAKRSDFPQSSTPALYWPRLNTEVHGWINWSWSGASILNFVNAFGPPHLGALTLLRGIRVAIVEAWRLSDEAFHPFQSGIVVDQAPDHLLVVTSDGLLGVRGDWDVRAPHAGDRFYTPPEKIDAALATRAYISPTGKWSFKRGDRLSDWGQHRG